MTENSERIYDDLLHTLDIRAIAATDQNMGIGYKNSIPWSIPEEMAFFKKMTTNAAVLMGRKTFESIGHPLPNRENIVITSNKNFTHSGTAAIQYIDQLLTLNINTPLWICGGETIYRLLLPACRELYLSKIFGEYKCDTKFPKFDDIFEYDMTVLSCETFKTDRYINKKILNK